MRSSAGKNLSGDSALAQRLTEKQGDGSGQATPTPGESRGSLHRVLMKSTLKDMQSNSKQSLLRRSLQNRPVSKSDIQVNNQGKKEEPII